MSVKRHNIAIAQAMEFTNNDLILNRGGQLSGLQMHKLDIMREMFVSDIYEAPRVQIPSVIILVVIGIVTACLNYMGIFSNLQQWLGSLYLPLLIGISLFILGWFLFIQFRYRAVRSLLPVMIDDMVQAPSLYSITGEVTLSTEELPGEINYWLDIGYERFSLTASATDVFQNACIYRVFYVNFADVTVLMSAELLQE